MRIFLRRFLLLLGKIAKGIECCRRSIPSQLGREICLIKIRLLKKQQKKMKD